MGRAFQARFYSMREIAEHFGVYYSTVSRAVRRLEVGRGPAGSRPPGQRSA